MMDLDGATKLQQEIGSIILNHRKYSSVEWDAAAIVVSLFSGREQANGYIYSGNEWEAKVPSSNEFMDKCIELQSAMAAPGAEPWKRALIHITKPGPEINIQFEYDDPTRWSLKKVSLDLSDYAESLRPPRK